MEEKNEEDSRRLQEEVRDLTKKVVRCPHWHSIVHSRAQNHQLAYISSCESEILRLKTENTQLQGIYSCCSLRVH